MPIKAPERSERWIRNIKTKVMPHEKFSVGGANGFLLQVCPSGYCGDIVLYSSQEENLVKLENVS